MVLLLAQGVMNESMTKSPANHIDPVIGQALLKLSELSKLIVSQRESSHQSRNGTLEMMQGVSTPETISCQRK
jgi:hypothetical protein